MFGLDCSIQRVHSKVFIACTSLEAWLYDADIACEVALSIQG